MAKFLALVLGMAIVGLLDHAVYDMIEGPRKVVVLKLTEAAQKGRRRLDGHNQLPKPITGVTLTHGIGPRGQEARTAAA